MCRMFCRLHGKRARDRAPGELVLSSRSGLGIERVYTRGLVPFVSRAQGGAACLRFNVCIEKDFILGQVSVEVKVT